MASSINSSLTSFAPASTIRIASFVPLTVKSILLLSISATVGLIINLPSTYPTLTAPVGPSNGMSLTVNAIELPSIASGSGGISTSTDKGVAIIDTSL